MRCSSCDKAKAELFPRKSSLLRGISIFMCRSCLDSGLEPRWIIILAGRREGTDYVRDFVVKSKYIGAPIRAEELIK